MLKSKKDSGGIIGKIIESKEVDAGYKAKFSTSGDNGISIWLGVILLKNGQEIPLPNEFIKVIEFELESIPTEKKEYPVKLVITNWKSIRNIAT